MSFGPQFSVSRLGCLFTERLKAPWAGDGRGHSLALSQRRAHEAKGVGEEPLEKARCPDGGSGGRGRGRVSRMSGANAFNSSVVFVNLFIYLYILKYRI